MSSNNIDVQLLHSYPDIEKQLNTLGLAACFHDLKLQTPVSFIFMSDDELLEVNRDVLQHDYYTDVITFNYDDEDIEFNEILISVDRIQENAVQFKSSLYTEIHRICIHGMLHLAGYDDQLTEDRQKMTALENHYLALHCST